MESGTKAISDYNGVIMTKNSRNIHVEGTVHGQITIYSTGKIFVEADLKYRTDPRIDPNSTDVCGLVAEKEIYVQYTTPNMNDCEIHASVLSVQEGLWAEYWWSGGYRGAIIILGGIYQKDAGVTGQLGSNGEIKNRYNEKYIYDTRFYTIKPPYFPGAEETKVFSWSEKWQ